ncbi:MAG: transaldolase [Brevibacterium aurantiacum]|uniref:Transaldolase n=1 Tax=Brevibacterium aurantiacum TaxID=273384 RepID=A0A1D7W469_BREAU|nr:MULTISPECIES: transaldolase [Brevibacterium]MDN5550286.1 transaldolase [Brevibacterium sp.]AOP53853.1 Transaldolase [Brevibacterium aurantiacum]AZL05964.1 transaldolase [Brevibacterium aurantiacum]AZL09526.1 transaldolase [Brevibacterium aurantiacum]AZL13161.1 transaldolase [Brevibacterium aurantiacum]
MSTNLTKLSEHGVSIWLDDLSRTRLESGDLARLIEDSNVTGVTTNPTIFANAIAGSDSYDSTLAELGADKVTADEAIESLTTSDVAAAARLFRPVYDATNGDDGRVSIEVAPPLAHDAEGTVAAAKALWERVGEPNAMIKIPATEAGLRAISETIAAGISVNVTLVFSLTRYRHVVEAFLQGLEKARAAGHDLSQIKSVASIFVSRVDAEIDARLDGLDDPAGAELKGRAGIANCVLAHEIHSQLFTSERFRVLELAGATPQRLLWASTGVKNPDYPDTMYVSGLVSANTVNTMPEPTMQAFADHGEVTAEISPENYRAADEVFDRLARLGIDYAEVMTVLETQGLEKFDVSWAELQETIRTALDRA